MKIFCMSDIHGCLKEFEDALSLIDLNGENMLILLGDYIDGGKDGKLVLNKIIDLQNKYGKRVIALLGNHELAVLENKDEEYLEYYKWLQSLPRYYEFHNTIFVHAGIDEEAGELWKLGTMDHIFTQKYPASIGKIKDLNNKIVAGHISTSSIFGSIYGIYDKFYDILYDGASHYYIDSDVLNSGKINVLMIENDEYYQVNKDGINLIKAIDKFEIRN